MKNLMATIKTASEMFDTEMKTLMDPNFQQLATGSVKSEAELGILRRFKKAVDEAVKDESGNWLITA